MNGFASERQTRRILKLNLGTRLLLFRIFHLCYSSDWTLFLEPSSHLSTLFFFLNFGFVGLNSPNCPRQRTKAATIITNGSRVTNSNTMASLSICRLPSDFFKRFPVPWKTIKKPLATSGRGGSTSGTDYHAGWNVL